MAALKVRVEFCSEARCRVPWTPSQRRHSFVSKLYCNQNTERNTVARTNHGI